MSTPPRSAPQLAVPPAAGVPGIVQGAYGDRGNLELAFADPADGLWVCWFNADRPSEANAADDVPPGSWSRGLRFAEGRRYRAVSLAQAQRGPDFLECLATADDGLHRWTWSPGPGFVRTDVLALPGAAVPGSCAIAETGLGLVATGFGGGRAWLWRGVDAGYPQLAWGDPVELNLPDDAVAFAAEVSPTSGRVSGMAVARGSLHATADIEAGGWRAVSVSEQASGVVRAAPGRGSIAQPPFVVTAARRLLVVDADGAVVDDLPGDEPFDAVAAAWSGIDAPRLEVVQRLGSALRHRSV